MENMLVVAKDTEKTGQYCHENQVEKGEPCRTFTI